MTTFSASSVIDLNATPVLQIRLLGEFGLTYGDEVVRSVGALRLQSLLALLVLRRNAPQSRRHLAFTLWPESTERQARTNLRRELHNLRQALPSAGHFLSIEMQTLQWRPDANFTLDAADFEEACSAAQRAGVVASEPGLQESLTKAISLYKGDLLPGCFDDWLLTERARLRQVYLQLLKQLIALLLKKRDYQFALEYAQLLLREDPLDEEAYLCLIRLYTLAGDRAKALRVYHSCVTILQRELEVEPGPATRQAYEQLLRVSVPKYAHPAPQTPLIGTPPLVGRQEAWQRLELCWNQAADGQPRFVAVTGDAGIGKTRLVEAFVDWASRQNITTAHSRCYASKGGLAYAPVADWLRAAGLRTELLQLEDVWLNEVARLLPEILAERPELSRPEAMSESWQRQYFFEALARAIFIGDHPLLLVIDDLQWTDRESLAWLNYLLSYRSRSPLLIAATIRSPELDSKHPVASWLLSLRSEDQLTEVELGPLSEGETALLAGHIAGIELNAAAATKLYAETEGHPLMVVEVVRAGEQRDVAKEKAALSPKVQAVIELRLVQLSPLARRIANLAAAIGRAFTFDVLAEASQEEEDRLVEGLDELWQRRIIREQSDHDYDFSHDKIREVVYNSLSAANRRLLHRRIAVAIETVSADSLDSGSKQIARHYEAAGITGKAIAYYRRAGEVAQQIYANADAAYLYSKALQLLNTLPNTPERTVQELTLQRLLSIVHRNTKGYAAAEVGQALNRALTLCRQFDQADVLGPVLWGLFTFNYVRSDLRRAHKLGQDLFTLAQEQDNPALLQAAHYALGGTLCSLGAFEDSLNHFEQGIALYGSDQHRSQVTSFGVDLGVFCQAWSAHPMWHLGYLDQSLQRGRAAVALAKSLGHPFSCALAMAYASMLFQLRRNSRLVEEWAGATIEFCAQQGIGYYDNWAAILHGWALAERGEHVEGIGQIQKGLVDFRAADSEVRLPYYLSLLAESYGNAGQIEEGLECLREALVLANKNDDHWYSAETHRQRGDLLLRSGQAETAEGCFQKSLEISRRQKARTLELRATVSLARLWRGQNRQVEARQLLEKSFNWFSEGLDTVDLKAAATLVEELS